MAKTITIELDGTEYSMKVSLSASRALVRKGIDPYITFMEMGKAGYLTLSEEKIVDVIYTGIRLGGQDIDRAAVAESVFQIGVVSAAAAAAEYITDLVLGDRKLDDLEGEAEAEPEKK